MNAGLMTWLAVNAFIFEMVGEGAQVTLLACPMRWGQRMTRGHHNRVGCVLYAVRAIGSHLFLVAAAPPLGSIIHLRWQQFYTAFSRRLQNFCFNPHADTSTAESAGPRGPVSTEY